MIALKLISLFAVIAIAAIGVALIKALMQSASREDTELGIKDAYGDFPRLDQIRHGDDFDE